MSTISNPAAVIDTDTLTVRRTIRIAAAVPKVWDAVTVPEHISRWFGLVVLDGEGAGALGTISWADRGSVPLRVEAVDAQRSISYRWSNDDAAGSYPDELDEAHSTVFTFTLQPVDGGTELTVEETGFEVTSDPAANLASHREGWTMELDELTTLMETGS